MLISSDTTHPSGSIPPTNLAKVAFVETVCEDLLAQLVAAPHDQELRTRLETYVTSVDARIPELELEDLGDSHLQVLPDRLNIGDI